MAQNYKKIYLNLIPVSYIKVFKENREIWGKQKKTFEWYKSDILFATDANFFYISHRNVKLPTLDRSETQFSGHHDRRMADFSDTIQLFRFRRYGTKCGGCGQGISPSDLVRKAKDKVFHLNCFTCLVCRKQLSTGEELYVLDDNKFICKEDYLSGNKAAMISSHHQGRPIFLSSAPLTRKMRLIKKNERKTILIISENESKLENIFIL